MQAQPLSLPPVPEPTYGERLKNKVVVITGAAQGIGEAIVACFQAQQARLVIGDIQGEKVEQVAAHWREHGAEIYAQPVDITSKDQWRALVDRQRAFDLHPPKRIGQPIEVAMTALFLATDEAPFINATCLMIDGTLALTMALSGLASAEEVKIGFLVKQAEEPWFQTEWAFAEKAGKDHGFTVIKIAVPDGEKTLSAIDTLAANGAKGFVICPPDVSLGPAIMAKAKLNNLKVLAVDDRFVDAKGKPMEDVPYVGLDAYKIGQKQGEAMATEAKHRNWDWKDTYAVINTFDELETGKKRTDGSVEGLKAAGLPVDHILFTAQKTLDVPGAMDSTNSALVKLPSGAKNLLIGGMNDSTVLGGVRATESAGFKATNVIGVGINGTDAIEELKKSDTGFYGSMLLSPDASGYKTATSMFDLPSSPHWIT
eukprot:gene8809-10335_t